jgi:hypothetical protein
VNPKIARPALERQRADEVEYAQLLNDNVSVAPIYSGLDGGMNKVFLVAQAVGAALDDADLVVEPLDEAERDLVLQPAVGRNAGVSDILCKRLP